MLKDTIISAFNYDGTLLKWLKKVEDALQNASASEFRVNKKGNATISFSIVFANGNTLESGDIVLQQGESVTGATIRQGHLILTLSNGNELDAGDLGAVTGFSINDSQHLIVTYQNGTTQDLGAIFNGNITVNGYISQSVPNYEKPFEVNGPTGGTVTVMYNKFEVINNVLYIIANFKISNNTENNITFRNMTSPWQYITTVVSTKIVDLEGMPVSVPSNNDNTLICANCALTTRDITNITTTLTRGSIRLLNETQPNACMIVFDFGENVTLQPSESIYYTARIALTLI